MPDELVEPLFYDSAVALAVDTRPLIPVVCVPVDGRGLRTCKGINTHQNMHQPPAEEMDEKDCQKSVQANLFNLNVLC